MKHLPLSAVIITCDAEAVLPECLASLDFADEILVVDSGSCDATLKIALAGGAKVLEHPWLGYGPQKKFAVQQATYDWVLCLDADERISDPLRVQLCKELVAPRFYAYTMPRRNRFMGRWLCYGEGYPDLSLRLFHRDHAQWCIDPIHEQVQTQEVIGRLQGDILHDSAQSLENYLDKQNRYTTLQAQELRIRDKRIGLRHLFFSPLLRFVKFYFLRRGFLDGVPGLVHIGIGCFNSFMKYAKARVEKTPNPFF